MTETREWHLKKEIESTMNGGNLTLKIGERIAVVTFNKLYWGFDIEYDKETEVALSLQETLKSLIKF